MSHAFLKLPEQIEIKKSRLILGLDPDESWGKLSSKQLFDLIINYISELAPYIVGIKPNLAFYEMGRRTVLTRVMKWVRKNYPELLIIEDAKRGDIFDTQDKYAAADIKNFNPDAMTINSYMGHKATQTPYYQRDSNLCAFSLVATSNPDTQVQELWTTNGLKVYQEMALENRKADPARTGFVIGSTKPEAVKNVRSVELENGYVAGDTAWVLGPGFGKQGGSLEFVKYAGPNSLYPISSGLLNPKYLNGKTPVQAAIDWRDAINAASAEYDMKSVSEQFVEDIMTYGLMKIAPSADQSTWWTLKSKKISPTYFNLRAIQSIPLLRKKATYLMSKMVKDKGLDADHIVAVPFGSLCLAYDLSTAMGRDGKSVLTPRPGLKEADMERYLEFLGIPFVSAFREKVKELCIFEKSKKHGMGGEIVGLFKEGDTFIPVEDVATSGGSILDIVDQMMANGLNVNTAIVLMDRQEGAYKSLIARGITLHSVMTQTQAVEKLDPNHPMKNVVLEYLRANVELEH